MNPRLFLQYSVLAATLLAFGAQGASAQEEGVLPPTFTSDRPGFANSTGVAAQGHLTAELGVQATFDEDAPGGSLPNLSLRAGLFEWLELRVRGPNAVGTFPSSGDRFGLGDPWVGFKLGGRLADSLAISADWEVSLPVGTDDFGAPEAEFFADVNVDWNFWGPLTLTPNAVASVLATLDPLSGETERIFEGGFSLKFTWQILDVLAAYVQSYVLASEVSDLRVQVGGGLAWMVAPNVQVDASFDIGVTEQGDPPTAALGTTVLF